MLIEMVMERRKVLDELDEATAVLQKAAEEEPEARPGMQTGDCKDRAVLRIKRCL
jgi:hypothetical protein